MPSQRPSASDSSVGADAASAVEAASERIRELNERILSSAKQAGSTSLDAYEKALQSLVDFEQKAAGATQLDWVSAVADAHARFISEVSGAYVKASRELLK
jgi:hypothetical protein